jgi:hypothetical protein
VVGNFTRGTLSASSNPITSPAGIRFSANPNVQPVAETYGLTPSLGNINITDKNFKFPQTFRTNIAVDKQLPWGLVGTLEGIYSKGINNIIFENLNREVNPTAVIAGVDNRPYYYTGVRNTGATEVILFKNTNKGYTYNIVAQLQKAFQKGWTGSASYTFGRAVDVFPATSSTALSNWQFINNIYGPNDPREATANFDTRHRVSGFISYRKEYAEHFATQITVFYNGQSGQPISYLYNGDLNNDGATNDLIYVPRNASEINLVPITGATPRTVAEQWAALDAFIEGDKYLKTRRGEYSERNKGRLPFQQVFDVRLLQDFSIVTGKTTHKLQLSLDILNAGNLLNKKWGSDNAVSNQGFNLINLQSTSTTPAFTYNAQGQTNGQVYSASNFNSRWRAQVGIRYIFN